MQNTTTLQRPNHRPALQNFAAQFAHAPYPVTVSEIEEYVSNLWTMDEDPYLYTTD